MTSSVKPDCDLGLQLKIVAFAQPPLINHALQPICEICSHHLSHHRIPTEVVVVVKEVMLQVCRRQPVFIKHIADIAKVT
jgi:hypothetical protein